jgi:UDPglucose--hexose-1-phosphate uridylyltransferase
MAVRFKKSIREVKLLDYTNGFKEKLIHFEFRFDPLTRRRARIMNLKFRVPAPPDLEKMVTRSLEYPCPFCEANLEKMTPKFAPGLIPEGRIRVGEAVVLPNFMPYGQNNGMVIFSKEHFIGLPDFSEEILVNGFLAAQDFFKRIYKKNAKNKYISINWNYMPPSGASQIHPHLHLMADRDPSDYHGLVLQRGKRFLKKFKVNYWADLIEEEKRLDERFLGETGDVSWLLSFAPKGMMFDTMGIFRESLCFLDITPSGFRDFACGLIKIFHYLHKSNLFSFNLTIFSGLKEKDYFWNYCHLIPRFVIPPMNTSDLNYIALLHDESISVINPEDVCPEMKGFF